jgi:ubiquinone/menaquinone biosynthesis C-methylase UbiE
MRKKEAMSNFSCRFKDQVRLNFDISKEAYIQFEQKHAFYGKLTNQLVDHVFQKGLVPSGWEQQKLRILDVGCGIGNSSMKLQELFPNADIFGLDLSSEMLEAAKERCPGIDFVCGDGEKLLDYFEAGGFDLVIYPASLFILPNQEESLRQARELLKEGGIVAASVIQGMRDKDNTQINALAGIPGIVRNEKLNHCLEELFINVSSSLLQVPMSRNVLRDIYAIPALLAGLFPKFSPQDRSTKLEALIAEIKERNLELLQEWLLIAAIKRK